MEIKDAVSVLSALAQPTRYRCVSLLSEEGDRTAGELAVALGVPANTMSSHLAILAHAGLVASARSGRNVVYSATTERVRGLIALLQPLAGRPEA